MMMTTKRILFLIQGQGLPSSRVRVLNLIPELERHGLLCTVKAYPRRWRDRLRLFRKARNYDLVFLQKKIPSWLEARTLRRVSRKWVFDFDDAIYYRHESQGHCTSRTRAARVQRVLRLADAVIVGNLMLKQYANRFNRQVHIVPSCVETRSIPLRRHLDATRPQVIGWVGGAINLPHLQGVAHALREVATKHNVELHLVCDETTTLPGVPIRFIPWQADTQADAIARFDVGIMPLPDSPHAAGKCAYKALQYMAAGVPPVVSDVGINRRVVEHGVNGMVAKDEASFAAALDRLLADDALRARLGAAARAKVERAYSIEKGGQLLAALLKSLTNLE